MIIGLVSSMITARLLSPEEIGTFAIASSVVMIMAEFRILGANTYLVREAEVTVEKIRSAYGLTILISWGLGIFIALASWPLENFFGVDGLAFVFLILSFSFFFAPYISVPNAMLTRNYRFREIVTINIVASVIQLLLVIVLILKGFSFYSLAIGQFATVVIKFALNIYFTRDVKVYMPRFNGMGVIAKLGIYTSLSHMLRNTQQTFPDILIGKLGSPTQVGIFSRGLGFTMFVSNLLISGVTPVVLPYFSEVKNKGQDIVAAYRQVSELITGIVWPVVAVASVASLPAIRLMFGDQWDEAAPVAMVAAFWVIFRAGHVMAPHALIAVGHEGAMLLKEIIVFVIFLLATYLAYLKFGLMGVAYAFVFSGFIDFMVTSWFVERRVGLGFLSYCVGMSRSLLIAFVCWVAARVLDGFISFEHTDPFIVFLYLICMLPLMWVCLVFVLNHPLKTYIRVIIKKIYPGVNG